MRTRNQIAHFAEAVQQRLNAGQRVRRSLQSYGRLHIDHPVPFLCVYRRPRYRDQGTEWLVVGEGSYLIADAAESEQADLGELVAAVLRELSTQFGAVLLLELWSEPPGGPRRANEPGSAASRAVAAPSSRFQIHILDDTAGRSTVATLARSLRSIKVFDRRMSVQIMHGHKPVPPRMPSLITTAEAARLGVLGLGLEVPSLYQDTESGEVFPSVLRLLQRELSAGA